MLSALNSYDPFLKELTEKSLKVIQGIDDIG